MGAYRIDLLPENDHTNGWAAHLPPRSPRPHLIGDVRADWIVIGAGWAGLAAAYPAALGAGESVGKSGGLTPRRVSRSPRRLRSRRASP